MAAADPVLVVPPAAAAPAMPPAAPGLVARLLPAIVAGLIGGLLTLSASIAYPAVIFAGPTAPALGLGITLALFTSTMLGAIVAWRSTYPATIAHAQIETAVVLGSIAVIVAETLATAPAAVGLATLLAVIATSTLLLGLSFILMGVFQLGNAIRYIPFPVIGGFLAFIAFLLARGGLTTMTGGPLTVEGSLALFAPDSLVRWLPGAALALGLIVLQRRRRHFLNVPLVLLAGLVLFWLVAWLAGSSSAGLLEAGFVLAPLGQGQGWSPLLLPQALPLVDWGLILALLPKIAVVSLVAMITLLLSASTLEVASRRPVDLNRELIVTGCGNLAAGLGAGLPGYHSVSASLLPHYLGTRSRLVGLISAAMCGATLFFGGHLLAFVPKLLIGLVLIYLALDIAAELALDRWPRLFAADQAVLALVFAALVGLGVVEGIVIGIGAGLTLFAVSYAKIGAVRAQGSGRVYGSNVVRPPSQRALLARDSEAIHVVRLQGYLFFGTAHRLLGEVTAQLAADRPRPLRFLVLDFGRVSGVDSSAVASFVRLIEAAEVEGFEILLAALPEPVARVVCSAGNKAVLPRFGDLDHALEHAENALLGCGPETLLLGHPPPNELALAFPDPAIRARLLGYATPIVWQPGEAVCAQGEESDRMYFIEGGRLSAWLTLAGGQTVRLRTFLPGTVVGEVGCYLGVPRSVTVIAESGGSAHAVSRGDLDRMRADDSDLAADFHAFMVRLAAGRFAYVTRYLEHHDR